MKEDLEPWMCVRLSGVTPDSNPTQQPSGKIKPMSGPPNFRAEFEKVFGCRPDQLAEIERRAEEIVQCPVCRGSGDGAYYCTQCYANLSADDGACKPSCDCTRCSITNQPCWKCGGTGLRKEEV